MAVTITLIMLLICTLKWWCMCRHRAALSQTSNKCDISGKCQPHFAHTQQLICTCTINTAHPKFLSTAHMHNVCTEHALQRLLLQGPDNNAVCGRDFWYYLLPGKSLTGTLIWDTQDWSVPASQSSPCPGLSTSSSQTPVPPCIFCSGGRNMTDLIIGA